MITREQGNAIVVTEETHVGGVGDGRPVKAENLSVWAYRRLQVYPAMLETLKSLGQDIGLVQDYLSDVDEDDESGELLVLLNKLMERVEVAITKAEGR